MKIFASTLQCALYEANPQPPVTANEQAWADCLEALKRGERIEIDYSSRYDESGSLISRPAKTEQAVDPNGIGRPTNVPSGRRAIPLGSMEYYRQPDDGTWKALSRRIKTDSSG